MYDSRDIAVESIRIKQRVRRDLGDVTSLMESLRRYGQLTPIILNQKNELIAGHRRLESAKRLGWSSIRAIIVDRTTELDMLEVEMEENIQRRELTPDELTIGFRRMDRLRHPGCLKRVAGAIFLAARQIFRRKPRR